MKKLIIILLISMWSSDVLAQRDYEAPGAKAAVRTHKNFAIIPFKFIITAKKPKKMTQKEFEKNTENAEKDGRTSCQAAFAARILKKMSKGKIVAQLQPVARTNALLSRAEISQTAGNVDTYLPEELCEVYGNGVVLKIENNLLCDPTTIIHCILDQIKVKLFEQDTFIHSSGL